MSAVSPCKLFEAIDRQSIEALDEYLSKGATVNLKNSAGDSAIYKAVLSGNEEIVQRLIDAGADVNIQNHVHLTALELALTCGLKISNAILKRLINVLPDVNRRNPEQGHAVLHLVAWREDIDLIKCILNRGADVNVRDNEGWTPLHWAAYNFTGNFSTIEALLAANANINAITIHGKSPIYALIDFIHKDELKDHEIFNIFNVFSNFKADFNTRDRYNQTPLDYALSFSGYCDFSVALIDALIKYSDADVNSVYTPKQVDERCNQTFLHQACLTMNLPLVKFLLKNGANIDALDSKNEFPLYYALLPLKTSTDVVEYLLKWNPNINTVTKFDLNILNCRKDYPEPVWKTLMRQLAKLEATGTPLHANLKQSINEDLDYESYYKKCQKELKTAEYRKVPSSVNNLGCASRVTFMSLLVDDKKKLVKYARRQDLVEEFIRQVDSFKIYGGAIRKRFSKAISKMDILKSCEIVLSFCLGYRFGNSRHIVIEKILSYCQPRDLKNLLSIIDID